MIDQLIGWLIAAFLALCAAALIRKLYTEAKRRSRSPWDNDIPMEANHYANRTPQFETGAAANSRSGRARTTQIGMGSAAELDCGAPDQRAREAGL